MHTLSHYQLIWRFCNWVIKLYKFWHVKPNRGRWTDGLSLMREKQDHLYIFLFNSWAVRNNLSPWDCNLNKSDRVQTWDAFTPIIKFYMRFLTEEKTLKSKLEVNLLLNLSKFYISIFQTCILLFQDPLSMESHKIIEE